MLVIKKLLFIFISFFLLKASSQDIAIGDWRTHLPYNAGVSLTETNNNISCATDLSLFSYDLDDQSIQTFSKVSGLSGVGIQKIAYSNDKNVLLIVYDDANIDLIYPDQIYNLSDIQRKSMVGQKSIKHIYFFEEVAYLSFSFGIVVLDINKKEIRDTYIIGENGDEIGINSVCIYNDSVFAATDEGLKKGALSNINLSNFNFWDKFDSGSVVNDSKVASLTLCNDTLFALVNDSIFFYDNVEWRFYYENVWTIYFVGASYNNLFITEYLINGGEVDDVRVKTKTSDGSWLILESNKIFRPLDAIKDKNGVYWILDNWVGLIRYDGTYEKVVPNGPRSTDVFQMHISNNELWVASGGIDQSWYFLYNRDGIFTFIDNVWSTYTKYQWSALDTMLDIICVDRNPVNNKLYFGSYGGGLLERDANGNLKVYEGNNSSLQGIDGAEYSFRISGLAFDDKANLWVSNYGADRPISVMETNGSWTSFKPNVSIGSNYVSDIVIDNVGNKWIVLPRGGGVLVFDDGGTIDDDSDDQYLKLGKGEGNGNLPNLDIFSIAKDNDGEIWVGTGEGVAVFYCPENIFSSGGCDAQQILVEQDGYVGYLFETEEVRSIAIDGANRKWFGTTNGVWLMSESGTEELLRFNESNSYLLSDYIIDIAINDETGEVFFGTDKGIISYKSTSTGGKIEHEAVYAYPNPVYENFTGTIAIKGLVDNADVKITDVSGTLIYETTALGGQAVWDGMDYNGNKAHTGVYLIWSTDKDGGQTNVTKLLIIN